MVKENLDWLLVFYSVPSKPANIRIKLWRKLAAAGAVQLKGAVYILPATEENHEFLQWLVGEVKSMGGDGAFVRSSGIETMEDTDIRSLFTEQIEKEYGILEKFLDGLDRKVQSVRKGTKLEDRRGLLNQLSKTTRDFEDIHKRDFFHSRRGLEIKRRLHLIGSAFKNLDTAGTKETASIAARQADQYKGRIWITRKHPFVDRMASAWLIKKFIDPAARFDFIEERSITGIKPGAVVFDMKGGEFTHHGDLCTFEVLVKAFNIKDKAVKKIAEIVHDLDVKDDKYGNRETAGLEEILIGVRKSSKEDSSALERGMTVFEMMYLSRS